VSDKKNPKASPPPSPLIENRVREYVRSLEAYSVPQIPCAVRLDGNEAPLGLPGEVYERVAETLRGIPFNRYPDPEALALRKTVAALFGLEAGQIVVGNGSDELIAMLLITMGGGTGRVLYPVPTFSMYGITAKVLGLETVEAALDDAFDIDIESTLALIDSQDPDLIFLASPNNPTGNSFSEEKIKRIIEASSGIVVVDEAYCDFSGTTLLPLLVTAPNLVILRTLSKIGFAALRLGFLFAGEEIAAEVNKARLPYNINSLTQSFAELILRDPSFITERVRMVVKERERVFNALSYMEGIRVFPSDANFHLIRVQNAQWVFDELVKRDVLVRNLSSPGALRDCLRVTVGTPQENDAFLAALADIFPQK